MSTFTRKSEFNWPALNRLIDEFGLVRTCLGCGCTEANACIDEATGEPCEWVEGIDADVCTRCAHIAMAMAAYCNSYMTMDLPEGKTCGDCVHIARCEAIFGPIPEDQQRDWFPNRFRLPQAMVEQPEDAPAPDEPFGEEHFVGSDEMVSLYTEGDANRAIAQMRAGGAW